MFPQDSFSFNTEYYAIISLTETLKNVCKRQFCCVRDSLKESQFRFSTSHIRYKNSKFKEMSVVKTLAAVGLELRLV